MNQIVHVCTSETFFHDAVRITSVCLFCGKRGNHLLGWVSLRCEHCGNEWSLDWAMPDCVREIRAKLKLTRKQMGEKLGYSPKTIKKYEWSWCSKPYFQKVTELCHQEIGK